MQGHNSLALDIDVDKIIDDLREIGLDYADKEAAWQVLDRLEKTVLAQEFLLAEGKTVGEREARARTAHPYRRYLEAIASAAKAKMRARVLYDTEKSRIDLIRTRASSERAAMGRM